MTKIERLNLPPGYQHYARLFPRFLADHPHQERNVLLMMRFRPGHQYRSIANALRKELAICDLELLRADDKNYSDDLWENVCLYMLGCQYGVAVFEEIDTRRFNPSVALELGFMMAHNKRCLILKDSRMERMPTDIVGKLYEEFDTYDIEASLTRCARKWIHDVGLDS